MKTPYCTTAAGAAAVAKAIENRRDGEIEVAPLQGYARKG
jgi:hypothetical protein